MTEAPPPRVRRGLPRRVWPLLACALLVFGARRLTAADWANAQPRQPRMVVFEALNSPT